MSTALIPAQPHALTPDVWHMINEVAPVAYTARMFGVTNKEQAAAIMLKGYELGFGLSGSFEFIKVILGKPELIPRGALAILHSSPEIAKIDIQRLADASGAYVGHSCTIRRRNGFEYSSRFTLADAQRADLMKKDSGWEKYPENMCLWRAVGFAADVAAPDLIAGASLLMKSPEQFGVGLSEGGDVIEGVVTPVTPEPSVLDKLVADFGPEKVMEANGGSIPATEAEVARAAEYLKVEVPW